MYDDNLAQGLHEWRPDDREFVILTAADWDKITDRIGVLDPTLQAIELLPVTLDIPKEN